MMIGQPRLWALHPFPVTWKLSAPNGLQLYQLLIDYAAAGRSARETASDGVVDKRPVRKRGSDFYEAGPFS